MITKRSDHDGWTEIVVWNEGDQPAYQSYRITCMDADWDGERHPPTARISLLTTTQTTYETVRRLAREYEYVADLASQLEAEKRIAYAALAGVIN